MSKFKKEIIIRENCLCSSEEVKSCSELKSKLASIFDEVYCANIINDVNVNSELILSDEEGIKISIDLANPKCPVTLTLPNESSSYFAQERYLCLLLKKHEIPYELQQDLGDLSKGTDIKDFAVSINTLNPREEYGESYDVYYVKAEDKILASKYAFKFAKLPYDKRWYNAESVDLSQDVNLITSFSYIE